MASLVAGRRLELHLEGIRSVWGPGPVGGPCEESSLACDTRGKRVGYMEATLVTKQTGLDGCSVPDGRRAPVHGKDPPL